MELIEKIIGLKEFKIISVITRYTKKLIINVETRNIKYCCPKCNNFAYSINHRFNHYIRDVSISIKTTFLCISRKVFYCNPCGYSFTEKLHSVLPRHIYTKRFEQKVFEDCLENTITNVARLNKLTYDCVRGIYERIADKCIEHLMKYVDAIEILGIDANNEGNDSKENSISFSNG